MGENVTLSINDLTLKTVALLALTRPSRSVDLAKLSRVHCKYSPEGVTFAPIAVAKQSRQGKPLTDFFFARFPENKNLCPVEAVQAYTDKTKNRCAGETQQMLFLALIKPHNAVTPSTIARWIKLLLSKAGIDTIIFKAHSVRGAATSAAASAAIQAITIQAITIQAITIQAITIQAIAIQTLLKTLASAMMYING